MITNFFREGHKLTLFNYLCVLSLSLFAASQQDHSSQKTSLFERTMMDMVGFIQESVFAIRYETAQLTEKYFFLVNVKEENKYLKRQNDEFQNKLSKLEELKQENQRLKNLLKFGEQINYKKILTRVIGLDTSQNIHIIRVNRGLKDGVKLEFPVVTNQGLIGYVYRVSNHYSDIMTILDQGSKIDGIVTKTRSHGIIEGYINGKCIMKYMTRNEPVSIGNQVITAGLSSIYPKGIKIGTISRIERQSYGITQFIEITPSVDFSKLEEVVILLPQIKTNKES